MSEDKTPATTPPKTPREVVEVQRETDPVLAHVHAVRLIRDARQRAADALALRNAALRALHRKIGEHAMTSTTEGLGIVWLKLQAALKEDGANDPKLDGDPKTIWQHAERDLAYAKNLERAARVLEKRLRPAKNADDPVEHTLAVTQTQLDQIRGIADPVKRSRYAAAFVRVADAAYKDAGDKLGVAGAVLVRDYQRPLSMVYRVAEVHNMVITPAVNRWLAKPRDTWPKLDQHPDDVLAEQGERYTTCRNLYTRAVEVRDAALADMAGLGWTQKEMAVAIGTSQPRLKQIRDRAGFDLKVTADGRSAAPVRR